jgi:hypothetical protein
LLRAGEAIRACEAVATWSDLHFKRTIQIKIHQRCPHLSNPFQLGLYPK